LASRRYLSSEILLERSFLGNADMYYIVPQNIRWFYLRIRGWLHDWYDEIIVTLYRNRKLNKENFPRSIQIAEEIFEIHVERRNTKTDRDSILLMILQNYTSKINEQRKSYESKSDFFIFFPFLQIILSCLMIVYYKKNA